MRDRNQHCRRRVWVGYAIVVLGSAGFAPCRVVAQEEALIVPAPEVAPRNGAIRARLIELQFADADEVVSAIKEKYKAVFDPKNNAVVNAAQFAAQRRNAQLQAIARGGTSAIFVQVPDALFEEIQVIVRDLDAKAARQLAAADGILPPQTWGSLKGRFIFDGQPPAAAKLPIRPNVRELLGGDVLDSSFLVAPDGGLANVAVWLRSATPPIHPDYANLRNLEATVQTIQGRFEPRVVPYWTEQPLRLRNLDPFSHNFKAEPLANPGFNFSLAKKKTIALAPLASAEPQPIMINDAICPWLMGWIVVQPHPYVAISQADGRFEIKNLPADTPLEFQVWHETAGGVHRVKLGEEYSNWADGRFSISLKPGETKDLGEVRLAPHQFDRSRTRQAFIGTSFSGDTPPGPLRFQLGNVQGLVPAGQAAQAGKATPKLPVLTKGAPFQLAAGKTTFIIPGVGELQVEGPVNFELIDDGRLRVSQGRVKLKVTDEGGHGFVIQTPTGKVTDLGLESSVSVDEAGKSDVVVRDGRIDVVTAPPKSNPAGKKETRSRTLRELLTE